MNKLSKEKLLAFDSNIESILSKKRIESYEGDIEDYYKNRILALEAGHKVAELEIYIRNKMDFCLKELEGENWIKDDRSLKFIQDKRKTPLNELSHHQILSRLTLGEIIKLIEEYEIRDYMLNLEKMDFKKYHSNNPKRDKKRNKFSNISKVNIALNLIRTIRNRAFHWENLQKTRSGKEGSLPRITHEENGAFIGIMPDKILEFLDDLIEIINNKTMKAHKDIEVKYKGI